MLSKKLPKNYSFWLEDLDQSISADPTDNVFDVAIVGGGFTGLNAALNLRLHGGMKVVLLEKDFCGSGASTQNAGFVSVEPLQSKDFISDIHLDAYRYLSNLIFENKIECNFQKSPLIKLATNMKMQQKFSRINTAESFYISPEEIKSESDVKGNFGGLVNNLSHSIHPGKYLSALKDIAIKQKCNLVEGFEVKTIKREGPIYLINNKIKAHNLICSTGAFKNKISKKMQKGFFQVGSSIIVSEVLDLHTINSISSKRRLFWDCRTFKNFLRITPDNRILFGGKNNIYPTSHLKNNFAYLKNCLNSFLNENHDINIEYSWSGNLGMTFNLIPFIGKDEKGIYYAGGYCGSGIAMSSYFGSLLAKMLMENESIKLPTSYLNGIQYIPHFHSLLNNFLKLKNSF